MIQLPYGPRTPGGGKVKSLPPPGPVIYAVFEINHFPKNTIISEPSGKWKYGSQLFFVLYITIYMII